ncbi:MAG: hypothetical protein WC220_14185 [Pedobacter sp.]
MFPKGKFRPDSYRVASLLSLAKSNSARLAFDCCSTGLRHGFESASRQIRNRFGIGSAGLRLAFGGKRRVPEERLLNCLIREESGTNLVPDRGVN